MINKQEIRIVTKIIRELSLFYMIHGYKQFNIDVKYEDKVTYFVTTISPPKSDFIARMKEKISREREMEVETYGWELIGDIDSKSELEIIGLLIDDMIVQEKEDKVIITLTRINRYKG
ncbi:hypothetical protein [Liberiplasma polymorphum]|jgi:hypothetical protein|uniref:hypothetical protein n=1 Tax=Liberiplasma polymorphum TaxID=3374570 RepID=UPI0037743681